MTAAHVKRDDKISFPNDDELVGGEVLFAKRDRSNVTIWFKDNHWVKCSAFTRVSKS